MPGIPTPNLGLIIPTVGDDTDLWGGDLNANFLILDGLGKLSSQVVGSNVTLTLTQPLTVVFATAGVSGVSVTLPAAAANAGRAVAIKKMDATAGAVTVTAVSGAVEITSILNQGQSVLYVSDGFNWWAIAQT